MSASVTNDHVSKSGIGADIIQRLSMPIPLHFLGWVNELQQTLYNGLFSYVVFHDLNHFLIKGQHQQSLGTLYTPHSCQSLISSQLQLSASVLSPEPLYVVR